LKVHDKIPNYLLPVKIADSLILSGLNGGFAPCSDLFVKCKNLALPCRAMPGPALPSHAAFI
jgi:hypothetical protein